MHVVVTFDSSLYLEIALAKLKENDIEDKRIVCIEMKTSHKKQQILDTMYHSNGISLFDGVAAWAVLGGTLGCVYGSVIKLGPIIMGLSGAFCGAFAGFVMDLLIGKKKWHLRRTKEKYNDLLLIIRCNSKEEMKTITSICENNNASSLGVHQ